ncbi:variant SH3 domain protein [Ancylostoma ceylanicum]|uniref:Variant SH3 domain protein n=1 Tax=Ancylostoma ceylanicum TaxID=53326 RepID=A0A0D6M1A2_9BILA|nr:variant SH3 domain protein [Ancylostoma ceylanicum]
MRIGVQLKICLRSRLSTPTESSKNSGAKIVLQIEEILGIPCGIWIQGFETSPRPSRTLQKTSTTSRKFTASEDVNYSSHSSRSSFRSESMTSRTDRRGRSTSSEIVTGSDTRSYPVYIAIQDYTPDANDVEAIPLEQGQIVEVLDKKNPASWLVRTKARPPQSGWIPGSYFETPTEYYKQRRRTREIEATSTTMTEDQEALLKRERMKLFFEKKFLKIAMSDGNF